MTSTRLLEGFPTTRMGLLDLRQRARLAHRGYDILNQKHEALTAELLSMIEDHRKNRLLANKLIARALESYAATRVEIGPIALREATFLVPRRIEVEIGTRNLMGILVPEIIVHEIDDEQTKLPSYNLISTSAILDDAIKDFRTAVAALIKLSETTAALIRLSEEITKTRRRVNALKEIVIPRIEATADFISFALEEREREEFVRTKKIKMRIESYKIESAGTEPSH